jgi:hypothetical protein
MQTEKKPWVRNTLLKLHSTIWERKVITRDQNLKFPPKGGKTLLSSNNENTLLELQGFQM